MAQLVPTTSLDNCRPGLTARTESCCLKRSHIHTTHSQIDLTLTGSCGIPKETLMVEISQINREPHLWMGSVRSL